MIRCCLLIVLLFVCGETHAKEGQWSIESAIRTVDMTSHLVKVSTTLEYKNVDSQASISVIFTVAEGVADNLSYLSASLEKDPNNNLKIEKVNPTAAGQSFRISFEKPVPSKESARVVVYEVYRSLQQPYPKEIKQADKQLVTAAFNGHVFAPYQIKTQTTTCKLPNSNIISFTKLEPSVQTDNTVEYGPFKDVPARSNADVSLHFENFSPFITVTSLNRWIEVSHWGGNIAVEETLEIVHSGAKLQGSFSRFDYMYARSFDTMPSIKSYKTILPAGAKDVYYRDEIGNISTSNMLELLDSVELEIRPRYPLFGGWITHYTLGYNLPSFQYLFTSGSDFALKMRFLDHIFDDMSVDEVVVKIILPEGSSDFLVDMPYEYIRDADTVHSTYLDFSGRPVITLRKANLVEDHIQDFTLRYKFSSILLLREPLMLVAGLLVLFLTVIGFVRLDFSISVDSSADSKMRIAGVIEQVLTLEGKREAILSRFEDAIKSFRKTKDSDGLQQKRRALDGERKEIRVEIDVIVKDLRNDSSELSEKVNALQKIDADLYQCTADSLVNAQKVVSGALSHDAFKKAEEGIEQRKAELKVKAQKVISQL